MQNRKLITLWEANNEELSHGYDRCFIVCVCPNYVALNCNGGFMMNKYIVFASEMVYYMKEVEAESQEQADELALDLEWDFNDSYDVNEFQIEEVRKVKA